MSKLAEEIDRLGRLAVSFQDSDTNPDMQEIDEDSADEIIAILDRDRQLALYGEDLDALLAKHRREARHEFPATENPIAQMGIALHQAAGWNPEAQPEIDAVILEVRSGRSPAALAIAFLIKWAGMEELEAARRLDDICGGDKSLVSRFKKQHQRAAKKGTQELP